MNLKVTLTVKRKSPSGRERSLTFESRPTTLNHADMKRLWEAERALNELVPGVRVHINVEDV